MKDGEMTCFQRVRLELLWWSARLFAVMPYWFKYYVVENVIFVLLYYVVRYRRKVVWENLCNSFPDKTNRELSTISRGFYQTLAEIFVDTINMSYITPKKVSNFLSIKGLDDHRRDVAGRDWVVMSAHFGCWEYNTLWGYFETTQMVLAVYHPLRDVVVEHFYQRLRTNAYSKPLPMNDSLRFYLRNRESGVDGKNLVMGLISDQNPPLRPTSHWFRFLNQDTVFFDGGEKLALRCKLPVYFLMSKRVARGRYQMSFEQLYDGVEEVTENEITERYVRRLETMISEHPELWMWSHRRWKHKRANGNS